MATHSQDPLRPPADRPRPRRRDVPGGEPLRVAGAVAGPALLAEALVVVAGLDGTAAVVVRVLGWTVAVAATLSLVVRPLLAQVAAARLESDDLADELARVRSEVDFRARFDRALAQTDAEPAAIRTALRAVGELQPDADVTLLLAVPNEPRVGWTVRLADGDLLPARSVPGTPGCAALAGNTTVTASSSSLDACAHLEDPDMAVSATCVPLRLGERVLGVVSIARAPGEVPDDPTVALLEWVVERTGVRVAEQRRLQGRSTAAREDEVTGLPGPAALDSHLRETLRSLTPFCLSIVDIDDFAHLRSLHGDEEADDVLRLLTDTLRLTLRPGDLVCRLQGGRFAVVLGNCAASQASLAMERVREALVLALSADEGVHVTFSAGIVESHRAESIEGLLEQARAAASKAHADGGNRVAVAPD